MYLSSNDNSDNIFYHNFFLQYIFFIKYSKIKRGGEGGGGYRPRYVFKGIIAPNLTKKFFNSIQNVSFWGWSRMGGGKKTPSLKSVTYIIKWWSLAQFYLTQGRYKDYINHVTHSLSSAYISIFPPKSAFFAISRNTGRDCILVHNC